MNPYTGLPYNQTAAGFNGVNPANPLQDSAVSQAVTRPMDDVSGDPKELIKWGGAIAGGAATSWAIDKSVDSFCKTATGNIEDSRLYKWGTKIDNKVESSSFLKNIEGWFDKQKNRVINKHKEIYNKSDKYKEASDLMAEGTKRESMLAFPSAEKHSAKELSTLIEHLQPEDFAKLGVKNGWQSEYVQALKNLSTAKDKKLVAEIVEKINKGSLEGFKDAAKLKINANKLGLIQKYLTGIGEGKASFLTKAFGKFGIGAGNIVGGGGFGIAMNALFIGMSIKSALDAPKGEKFSTFMEDLLANWIGGFLLMIPAAKLVNGMAGWKNLGMSAENRAKVADLTKKFYYKEIDKKAYKAGMKEITQAAKGKLNFGQKAMRLVGKLFSIGHDPVVKIGDAWAKKSVDGFRPILKALGKTMKCGLPGGIIRLAAVMLMIQPFTNIFKGISHKLFGTPTPPEELEKAKETANNNQTVVNNNTQTNQTAPAVNQNQNVAPASTTAVPANTDNNNSQEPVRTYIPSAEPAVFQAQQNTAITNVLNKSDSVMNYANNVLQGK